MTIKRWILGAFFVVLVGTCSIWAQDWTATTVNLNPSNHSYQSMHVAPDGTPYVAVMFGNVVYVSKYDGTAWQTVGSSFGDTSGQPMIYCVTGNKVYVSFSEATGLALSVYRWDGVTWNVVGSRSISAGTAVGGITAVSGYF